MHLSCICFHVQVERVPVLFSCSDRTCACVSSVDIHVQVECAPALLPCPFAGRMYNVLFLCLCSGRMYTCLVSVSVFRWNVHLSCFCACVQVEWTPVLFLCPCSDRVCTCIASVFVFR